ncbi:type IV secretory system conjugative DNA transfer family protein, partial [Pseudomonas amygdali]|uniref:type IV secretory system conjugative DNA transfer family protein n=1 Tax=Pseudomonas amygdali TaxID=47877 RepID=UPI004032A33C
MAKAKPQPVSPDNPQARIEEHPAFLLGKHPTEYSFLVAAPPGSGKPVGVV